MQFELILRRRDDFGEILRVPVREHLGVEEYIKDTAEDRKHQDQEYPDQTVSSLIILTDNVERYDYGDDTEHDRGDLRHSRSGHDQENKRRDLHEQYQYDDCPAHQK